VSFHVDLQGETALVTGGSRNIGLAVGLALRSAGARVGIAARSDGKALEQAVNLLSSDGKDAMGILMNVADEEDVLDLYDRVEENLGPVSVLVNGAAVRPLQRFTELPRKDWSEVVDVILTGAFLTSRELFRRLPGERKGAIVNVGGLSAHRPARDRVHVIAAKSGLIGLTRALAEEGLGRIRVNAVVPGLIDTERRPGQSNPHPGESDGARPRGTSRDVARAVLALCDPRDVYTTGQTLHVNGGRFMP